MIFKLWKLKKAEKKLKIQTDIIQAQMKEKSKAGNPTDYSKLPAWEDYRKARDEVYEAERPFKALKE